MRRVNTLIKGENRIARCVPVVMATDYQLCHNMTWYGCDANCLFHLFVEESFI